MKKVMLLFLIVFLVISLFVGYIYYNIQTSKQEFRKEAQLYLEEKYSQNAVVNNNVSISDIKTVEAYFQSQPELCFRVFKEKVFHDTYIEQCLRFEAENILKTAFKEYDCEIYVSGLKWTNPTEDGNNETYYYLDQLYKSLGRIPVWKDINEYQKIKVANVKINQYEIKEEDILEAIEYVKNIGCHIELLEIKDLSETVFQYSF